MARTDLDGVAVSAAVKIRGLKYEQVRSRVGSRKDPGQNIKIRISVVVQLMFPLERQVLNRIISWLPFRHPAQSRRFNASIPRKFTAGLKPSLILLESQSFIAEW